MSDYLYYCFIDDDIFEVYYCFGLCVIVLYKMVQVLGLLFVVVVVFYLECQCNVDWLIDWLEYFLFSGISVLCQYLVDVVVGFGLQCFVVIGLIVIVYVVLFIIEGVGLWLCKYWVEWFIVVVIGLLILLEVYEVIEYVSWFKFGILVGNVVIVVYLVCIVMQLYC